MLGNWNQSVDTKVKKPRDQGEGLSESEVEEMGNDR